MLLSDRWCGRKYIFSGKGHLGWQTTDHLLVNRGFESHVGYLGGSQDYKWGAANPDPKSEDPFYGKHDMWHNHLPGTDVVPLIYYSTEFYTGYALFFSPFVYLTPWARSCVVLVKGWRLPGVLCEDKLQYGYPRRSRLLTTPSAPTPSPSKHGTLLHHREVNFNRAGAKPRPETGRLRFPQRW